MKRATSVLLIEDDSQIRLLLRLALEAAGFIVYEAECGVDGLAQFTETPTDLLVIDLLLPDMDGAKVILDLAQEFPEVKIVAISGGSGDLLETAREFGAHRVLRKPLGPRQLVQALEELAGR